MPSEVPASVTAPWGGDDVAPPTGTFGRYRIERALGAGGMGVVVQAFDPELGRSVAIKFLRGDDPTAAERLVAEARAMARLSHPNVLGVHEVVRIGDRAGIVMDLVDGADLGGWLAAGPRTWQEIVDVYLQAARGLAAAHRAGLVHRDFKPANALIDREGVVRVSDFGLARTDEDASSGGGTPGYMAPEQRAGGVVDARSDQWALASALRRALASDQRAGRPAPSYVARALARATAVAPEDRFAVIDELIVALTPRRRRRGRAALVALAAAALVAAVVVTRQRSAGPPSCATLARDELGAAWTPPVQIGLGAGFARRGPMALETWGRTAAALSAHAAAWRTARVEACRADRMAAVAPTLAELRQACLRLRRGELVSLVAALREPSPETVSSAFASARTLSPPDLCLDVAELARREPLPDDPARRPAVAAARGRLVAATTAIELGQLRDARARLEILLGEVRAEGWPPLIAEVLLAAGRAATNDRDFVAAERYLDEAVLTAEAAGYDQATVRGLISLIDVRGRGRLRPADGLALEPRVRAVLARLGGDPSLTAALDTNRGRVLLLLGRYQEAFEVLTDVLSSLRAVDPNHRDLPNAEIHVGDALQKLGRAAEAEPHYQTALALGEARFGRGHVLVAHATYSVANGRLELHDYRGAIDAYRAALGRYEAIYGEQHALLAWPLNNIGYALCLDDRPAEALPVLERGLAINAATDRDPLMQAYLEGNVGDALRRLGRYAEAAPLLERSLAGFRTVFGPDNPQVVPPLIDVAILARIRGDRATATARLDEAAALTAAFAADHPLVVSVARERAALAAMAKPR